jgi:CRISPR-associated exonuclease Cas4
MLSVPIPEGALFYGRTRRRLDVAFKEALRREMEEAGDKARQLIASGVTPPPVYAKRCESCSLIGECLPKKMEKSSPVKRYLSKMTESGAP